MERRRVRLEELLRATLPECAGEGREGTWQCTSRPAIWLLEPSGPGFWLLLQGDLCESVEEWKSESAKSESATALSSSHFATLNTPFDLCWSWPLKPIRHAPGETVFWRAELYLRGTPSDQRRVEVLVEQVLRWGGRHGEAQTKNEQDKPPPGATVALSPDCASTMPEDWPQHLEEALGVKLQLAANGAYRTHNSAGPALELRPGPAGLQTRCRLLRLEEPLTAPTLAVLEDLLTVVNGMLRGCRALLENIGAGTEAWLESQVPWDDLADLVGMEVILAEATRLAHASRTLVDIPQISSAYREYLFPSQESDVVTR